MILTLYSYAMTPLTRCTRRFLELCSWLTFAFAETTLLLHHFHHNCVPQAEWDEAFPFPPGIQWSRWRHTCVKPQIILLTKHYVISMKFHKLQDD